MSTILDAEMASDMLEWIDWEGSMEEALAHGFLSDDFPNAETKSFFESDLMPAWQAYNKAVDQFYRLLTEAADR